MNKLRLIFSIFLSGREFKKLRKQFAEMAEKVQSLQSQLDEMRQELCNNTNIENIYVERINVDRFEFSNNFGSMGIRELGGTLNIGVNCSEEKMKAGKDKTTPPREKQEAKNPPSKRRPTPGSKTADPHRDQGNPTQPYSSNRHDKRKSCLDGLNNSSGVNKEAPPNKKQPKDKKDINKAIKFPEKQMGPVWNLYYEI